MRISLFGCLGWFLFILYIKSILLFPKLAIIVPNKMATWFTSTLLVAISILPPYLGLFTGFFSLS